MAHPEDQQLHLGKQCFLEDPMKIPRETACLLIKQCHDPRVEQDPVLCRDLRSAWSLHYRIGHHHG